MIWLTLILICKNVRDYDFAETPVFLGFDCLVPSARGLEPFFKPGLGLPHCLVHI